MEYVASDARPAGREPAPKLHLLPPSTTAAPPNDVATSLGSAERPTSITGTARRLPRAPHNLHLSAVPAATSARRGIGNLEDASETASAHLLGLNVILLPVCSYAGYRLGGFYGTIAGAMAGGAALNFLRAFWADGAERNVSIAYGLAGTAGAVWAGYQASKRRK